MSGNSVVDVNSSSSYDTNGKMSGDINSVCYDFNRNSSGEIIVVSADINSSCIGNFDVSDGSSRDDINN